jgi:biotin/methionine sulfoxide reductase
MLNSKDAMNRNIHHGDLVRVFNSRGSCLASASLSDDILSGVVKLFTGAWFNPDQWVYPNLDRSGNPNSLTLDTGASELSQGCSAQTCLVEIERFGDDLAHTDIHDSRSLLSVSIPS